MQIASMHFKERAHENMGNAQLQGNLQKIKGKFVAKRRESLVELDDFEATREAARAIRQRALDRLDVWLEIFEKNATARGATVLWAATPDEVNQHVLDIAKRHGVHKTIKSKSMVSEESALDRAIEASGGQVVETDLGEYILQINNYEPPSHIIGPALHKSKEEVSDLFAKVHGTARKTGIAELCLEARGVLRSHYLTAEMGISGGNFFVAETGSVVLVTNEGNATLTTTLPKVHVAISGIEKIVLTPAYIGIENALDLPQASTLCNQCGVVCPVKIPLPDLLRKLREHQFERDLRPWYERAGLRAWSWLASRPALYALATRMAVRLLSWMGGRERLIHRLPLGGGWTDARDMPAPAGKTFRELAGERQKNRGER